MEIVKTLHVKFFPFGSLLPLRIVGVNQALLYRLVIFSSDARERVRRGMMNEMEKMAQKYTNRADNPLKCRLINFQNEQFLPRDIHLTYEAQKERLSAIRKIYKMYKFS